MSVTCHICVCVLGEITHKVRSAGECSMPYLCVLGEITCKVVSVHEHNMLHLCVYWVKSHAKLCLRVSWVKSHTKLCQRIIRVKLCTRLYLIVKCSMPNLWVASEITLKFMGTMCEHSTHRLLVLG